MYLYWPLSLHDVLLNYTQGQHYYLTWRIYVRWWTSLAFLNSLSSLNIKISTNYNNREQIMNTVHVESLQMTRLNVKIEYNAYCYICNWYQNGKTSHKVFHTTTSGSLAVAYQNNKTVEYNTLLKCSLAEIKNHQHATCFSNVQL